jgi:hypothetical protein
MSSNMMIGYDIYYCFTMEHFRLRQNEGKMALYHYILRYLTVNK